MARPPAECGTFSGYRRHLRLKTPPCELCKIAARDQKNARKDAERADLGAAVTTAARNEPAPDRVDPLEEARDSLRIVRAALKADPPHNTISPLTKRRDELADRIKMLEREAAEEVDDVDALVTDLGSWHARTSAS